MYTIRSTILVLAFSYLPLFNSLNINRNFEKQNGEKWFEDHILAEHEYHYVKAMNGTNVKISDDYNEDALSIPECQINIRDLPQRKPLLRNPSTEAILLPDSAGSSVISLRAGSHFEIDCPGSNIIVDSTLSLGEVAEAECLSGTDVIIRNRVVDFTTVVCSRRVASIARYTGQSCWKNRGRETEVGFMFTDGHFIREMTTCFDSVTRDVYYSLFDLSHQIGDQNTAGTRPGWTEGDFYNLGVRLDQLYPNVVQSVTINKLVGLPDDSTKYVRPTGNYYLARGHLTARSDYIYYAQQEATFHYVNSVPQWQTLNGFNWAYLERNVRQYATRSGLDLVVMTDNSGCEACLTRVKAQKPVAGVHPVIQPKIAYIYSNGGYGISTLPHEETGEPVDLYLFSDDSTGAKAMPVPALFWKVVYSPSTLEGVAILGVNNPYLEDIESQIICPDIADKLTWLSFDRTIVTRGYIFACTIAELRKVIPEIPNYRVTGLLN